MTILQVYNGDADAVSMLDELEFCYSKFLGDKKSKEETADASDALVEILLSFASKQSQLFRRMSEQVFSAFADKVTATGLESLTSVCSIVIVSFWVMLTKLFRSWKPRRIMLVSKRCSKSRMKKEKRMKK